MRWKTEKVYGFIKTWVDGIPKEEISSVARIETGINEVKTKIHEVWNDSTKRDYLEEATSSPI